MTIMVLEIHALWGEHVSPKAKLALLALTYIINCIGLIPSAFLPFIPLSVGSFIILINLTNKLPMKVTRRRHLGKLCASSLRPYSYNQFSSSPPVAPSMLRQSVTQLSNP